MTRKPDSSDDPERAWHPFEPKRDGPWDAARVAHLHRRAAFGATWGQLQRDVAAGYEASLSRVLNGETHGPDGRPASEFAQMAKDMEQSARRRPSAARVRMLWLFRALFSPFPLAEVMTLAWHGHYPVGASKVRHPEQLLAYTQTLRDHWRGPISQLHLAILRDPAVLHWLDGFDSVKAQPNENLGREFLELFALGEGHYTERDVRDAARALTGRVEHTGNQRGYEVVSSDHDDGAKTILGETGPWNDEDLVRIVCKQPAAAAHVARRLYQTFINNTDSPDDALIAPLAEAIRTPGDVDVARGIEVVLRSRLFHSEACRDKLIKGPVAFAAGAIRSCAALTPPPDFVDLEIALMKMGQRVFDPPSVAGWPAGLAWLRGTTVVARANFAAALTESSGPLGAETIGSFRSLGEWLDAFATLLTPVPLAPARRAELLDSAQGKEGALDRRAILRQLLMSPECQIG